MQEISLDQLLNAARAAALLSIHKSTFLRYVKAGKIPAGIKMAPAQQSPRRWKMSVLQKYIADQVSA